MREYAGLKLREAGEEEPAELRCADYYRARCAQSALEGRYRLLDWLAWMDLEIDNIRAVLRRCLTRGDAATGLAPGRLARLVLDHPRDHRGCPLARRVPRLRTPIRRCWAGRTSCAGSWPC